jgi:general secretion pathway protein N
MNIQTARLVTKVLAGTCAVLAVFAIAQYAGLGSGYRWAEDGDVKGEQAATGAIDKKPVTLPPASAFAEIEAHPLFNEDREPTPESADGGDEAAPPPSPLNIALTGVILDEVNHVRIAMLQDKTRNQAVALKVGMPLEGDQASWTLIDVKPRLVVFRSAANETTEVALETSVVQPPPPRPAPRANAPAAPGGKPGNRQPPRGQPNAAPNPKDNGADLARRIEERRRQMREDAEKLRNGGKEPQPSKK